VALATEEQGLAEARKAAAAIREARLRYEAAQEAADLRR
jgi:hypothetical protein